MVQRFAQHLSSSEGSANYGLQFRRQRTLHLLPFIRHHRFSRWKCFQAQYRGRDFRRWLTARLVCLSQSTSRAAAPTAGFLNPSTLSPPKWIDGRDNNTWSLKQQYPRLFLSRVSRLDWILGRNDCTIFVSEYRLRHRNPHC